MIGSSDDAADDALAALKENFFYQELRTNERNYIDGLELFLGEMAGIKKIYEGLSAKELEGKQSFAELERFAAVMQKLIDGHKGFLESIEDEKQGPLQWAQHLEDLTALYEEQALTKGSLPFPEKVEKEFLGSEKNKAKQGMEFYLITPTQRAARFSLTFGELAKHSPHPDLPLVLDRSRKLAQATNQSVANKELAALVQSYARNKKSSLLPLVDFLKKNKELGSDEQPLSPTEFKQAFRVINFNQLNKNELKEIQSALDSRIDVLKGEKEQTPQELEKSQRLLGKLQDLKQFLINKPIYDKVNADFPIKELQGTKKYHDRSVIAAEMRAQLYKQQEGKQDPNLSQIDLAQVKKEAYLKAIKDTGQVAIKGGYAKQFDALIQEIKASDKMLKKLGVTQEELSKVWVPPTIEPKTPTPPAAEVSGTLVSTVTPMVHGFRRSLPIPAADLKPLANAQKAELGQIKGFLDKTENRAKYELDPKNPYETKQVGANWPHEGIILNFADKRTAYAHTEKNGVTFAVPKDASDADFDITFGRICQLAIDTAEPNTVFDLSVAPPEKQEALQAIFVKSIEESGRKDLTVRQKGPQQKI